MEHKPRSQSPRRDARHLMPTMVQGIPARTTGPISPTAAFDATNEIRRTDVLAHSMDRGIPPHPIRHLPPPLPRGTRPKYVADCCLASCHTTDHPRMFGRPHDTGEHRAPGTCRYRK